MCMSPNGQTHPHGWRDAPGAGLAVTEPEGAAVPGDRRVELQLMPLLLEGRRTRKDFHWPYSQLVLLLLLLLCKSCIWRVYLFAKLPHATQMADTALWQRNASREKKVIFSFANMAAED